LASGPHIKPFPIREGMTKFSGGRNLVVQVCVAATFLLDTFSHRGLLQRSSCDNDFGNSSTALVIPDASISWYLSHYLDCTHRAVWTRFVSSGSNFKFYVGLGTPTRSRFGGLRANALIVGPGLPQLSAQDLASLPSEVRNDPVVSSSSMGAILHRSPANQGTCDHMGAVMKGETSVVNGRCNFYEPFSRTNSWRLLDADGNIIPQNGGTYYVSVWLQQHTSGKIGIALGTWVENFVAPFNIATPSCLRNLNDWSEKSGDQDLCLPVKACPASPPIPRTTCTAQGTCGTGSCSDTISQSPLCTFGGMCNCSTVTQTHACGTDISSAMGSVAVNGVCGKTCNTCGTSSTPLQCGGDTCVSAVHLWEGSNRKMHKGMAIRFTGTPEVDFVRGMIPHHLGAVDMCDVLVNKLSCEDDGALSGLVHFCQHVRLEQEREVAGMRQWLNSRQLAENTTCCAVPKSNTLSTHALCTTARQCDCTALITNYPCGTTVSNSMGTVVVNEVCGGTCGVCAQRTSSHSGGSGGGSGMMQGSGTNGSGTQMSMGCGNQTANSSKRFMDANMKMHNGMKVAFSCKHDVDFSRAMIPHHAGAIEMCDILTQTAANPDAYLVELCANITRLQRAEIAFLSIWLAQRGHNVSAQCGCHMTQPQPPMPCEDLLPASSFCHVLGGDLYCTCAKVTATHGCGNNVDISGFGRLNVSAECLRTCGHCPSRRPPLFSGPCPGSLGHQHNNHQHQHGNQQPKQTVISRSCHNRISMLLVVAWILGVRK